MKRLVLVVFVIALILTSCSYELSDSTTEGEYLDVSQLEKIKNMDLSYETFFSPAFHIIYR